MSNYDIHANDYLLTIMIKVLIERLRQTENTIKLLHKTISSQPNNIDLIERLFLQGMKIVTVLSKITDGYQIDTWNRDFTKYLSKNITQDQNIPLVLTPEQKTFLIRLSKQWGKNCFSSNDPDIEKTIIAFCETGLIEANYSDAYHLYVYNLTDKADQFIK